MMQCEREERLEGKMLFWGKLEGNENDYLVCYALVRPRLEDGEFPLKKVDSLRALVSSERPPLIR